MPTVQVHIIDESEIGLTECGQLLPWKSASDPTPWDTGREENVAIWPEEPSPEGSEFCNRCLNAYMAHA
jgi:hypothetical protein